MIVFLLIFSAFLFTFSAGINAVSFPFVLYQNQASPIIIGIIEGVEMLAGIFIAKFLYGISRKVGALKTIIAFALIEASIILILPLHYNFFLWIFLAFSSGICWFSVIALRQSWINIATKNHNRSMVMALNSTALCAGFALGPIAVKLIGAGQYLVFITSAILILFSCLSLLLVKNHQPKLDDEKIDYWRIFKAHKNSFIARFLLDLQVIVVILFTVIYGIKNGFNAEDSGLLVSVFMLTGLADFLIGWMIKNKDLQKYINFGFFGALISMVFLPWISKNYYLLILAFVVYGWFISLIFLSLITKVNSNQNEKDLIAINSLFQAVGGLGALFGNLLVGIFMEIFDANGFVILIVGANLSYFILLILQRCRQNLSPLQAYDS
jgi:MFS family permease